MRQRGRSREPLLVAVRRVPFREDLGFGGLSKEVGEIHGRSRKPSLISNTSIRSKSARLWERLSLSQVDHTPEELLFIDDTCGQSSCIEKSCA